MEGGDRHWLPMDGRLVSNFSKSNTVVLATLMFLKLASRRRRLWSGRRLAGGRGVASVEQTDKLGSFGALGASNESHTCPFSHLLPS